MMSIGQDNCVGIVSIRNCNFVSGRGDKCMRGIWKGDSGPLELINGKEYEILSIEWDGQMANVIDETGDNFLYPLEDFELINDDKKVE